MTYACASALLAAPGILWKKHVALLLLKACSCPLGIWHCKSFATPSGSEGLRDKFAMQPLIRHAYLLAGGGTIPVPAKSHWQLELCTRKTHYCHRRNPARLPCICPSRPFVLFCRPWLTSCQLCPDVHKLEPYKNTAGLTCTCSMVGTELATRSRSIHAPASSTFCSVIHMHLLDSASLSFLHTG